MSEYTYKPVDFENPSFLFTLEDMLKGLLGGPLPYISYFKTFSLKGDEKVLDFGCGGGAGSKCLAKLLKTGGRLTCVDTSHYWIKKASRRLRKYPHVECQADDIRKLEIPDQSFDVISIFHVLHDIAPEERWEIVTTLCQKLKRNGTIFIREPVRKSHGMPGKEIRTLFTDAGLQEVAYEESKSEYRGRFTPDPTAIGTQVVSL